MNKQQPRWKHVTYGILILLLVSGCRERQSMSPTSVEDWKVVQVDGALTFRVPADAEEQHLQAVDTVADLINGPGYEIMYEYGQFGATIDQYRSRPGFAAKERTVDGHRAQEASFRAATQNSGLPVVHLLQIRLEDSNVFTLRLSCVDEATCGIYDELFDSVTLR